MRDSGRTRTAILRFGLSDPDSIERRSLASWYRVRESNPCYRIESPVSWPAGRTRHECARLGSNQRSPACHAGIHPLNCARIGNPISLSSSPRSESNRHPRLTRLRHDLRATRARWSGRQGSNLPGLRRERSAAPSGLVRIVPPVGLEPTHFRVRTGCSALELRRHGSRGLERLARRDDSVVMPRHTVSLSFRCELVLGEPSIHLCFSRPRFGLRGSNSHYQVQSLGSCHWTKPDCRRSGESRTLTSQSKNPVRCQLRHRPRSVS